MEIDKPIVQLLWKCQGPRIVRIALRGRRPYFSLWLQRFQSTAFGLLFLASGEVECHGRELVG